MHMLFCDCRRLPIADLKQAVWDAHSAALAALQGRESYRARTMERAVRAYAFAVQRDAEKQEPEQARDTLCTGLRRLKSLALDSFS